MQFFATSNTPLICSKKRFFFFFQFTFSERILKFFVAVFFLYKFVLLFFLKALLYFPFNLFYCSTISLLFSALKCYTNSASSNFKKVRERSVSFSLDRPFNNFLMKGPFLTWDIISTKNPSQL